MVKKATKKAAPKKEKKAGVKKTATKSAVKNEERPGIVLTIEEKVFKEETEPESDPESVSPDALEAMLGDDDFSTDMDDDETSDWE